MDKIIKQILLWLMALILGIPTFSMAADKPMYFKRLLELKENHDYLELGKYLLYIEDKHREWTIKDILSDDFNAKFKGTQQDIINLGFTESSYWLKLDVISKCNIDKEWLIELAYPHIDHIAFYVPDKTGQYRITQAGDSFPFSHREMDYSNCVFKLKIKPGEEKTIVFNVKTNGSLQLPLILWSPVALAEKVNDERFLMGLFYGSLIVMVLYNIFLFMAVRDQCFIYFVLYIICYILFQMALNGHGYEYLWPHASWWTNRSIPFFIGLLGFWGTRFSNLFLFDETPINTISSAIAIVAYSGLAISLFALCGNTVLMIRLSVIYSAFFAIILLIMGFFSYFKGNLSARYFLAAWMIFFLGSLAYTAKTTGLIPITFSTEYSPQIGSAIMVILFSLGLADRIHHIRRKSALETETALQYQQESIKEKEENAISQKQTSDTLEMKSNNIVSIADQLSNNAAVMNDQVEKVAGSSEEMNININMIASSVEEMSTNVTGISNTARHMNENINSVASAIEEMSASMTGVGENARQGSKVADEATKMAKKAGETMTSLGQAANEIGKVTEVIKRIADKTNLLALNAAIEAAAAGEAGKGFAVVANAIQKFADQSAEAAEDIATRISDVQVNTKEAVNVIADVSSIIEEINASSETIMIAVEGQTVAVNEIAANASEANSRADQIASAMAELTTGANDVARNIGEMAKGANEVAHSIRGVSDGIKDSNEGIFSIHQSANELADLAKQLSDDMSES